MPIMRTRLLPIDRTIFAARCVVTATLLLTMSGVALAQDDSTDLNSDVQQAFDAHDPDEAWCADTTFEPCGGNPVGHWVHGNSCMFLPSNVEVMPGCPEARINITVSADGPFHLNADGTYIASTDATTTSITQIPLACFGEDVTCAAMAGNTPHEVTDTHCELVQNRFERSEEAGTFHTVDATLTLIDPEYGDQVLTYCVDGDTLLLELADPSGFRGLLEYVRVPTSEAE